MAAQMHYGFYQNYQNYQRNAAACQAMEQGGFRAFCTQQSQEFLDVHAHHFNKNIYWLDTMRAKKPIMRAEHLNFFVAFYYARHFTAMQCAFKRFLLVSGDKAKKAKVIDYGCGQGLATLALMAYLAPHGIALDVHLVEPSLLAISAAQDYIKSYAAFLNMEVAVTCHQIGINAVDLSLMSANDADTPVLHLYSNVLDLAADREFDIQIDRFTQQLNLAYGRHFHFLVGPDYLGNNAGFDAFAKGLAVPVKYEKFTELSYNLDFVSWGTKSKQHINKVSGCALYAYQNNS